MKKIYTTDGACSGNPGPGGFGICGWCEKEDGLHLEYWFRQEQPDTTNNRMELSALIHVLSIAYHDTTDNTYEIHTDSAYCLNMLKPGGWIDTWANNEWKNSKKQTVENLDLVQIAYNYRNKILDKIQLVKDKGHSGDVRNEVTDAIASGNQQKLKKFVLDNDIIIDFN